MSELIFGLVLAAAVLHALWNAMVKGGEDLLATMTVLCLSASFVALLALCFFLPLPAIESWFFLACSLVVHLGYKLCLLAGYRYGALGQVYPIARGGAALVVLMLSLLFLDTFVLSLREVFSVAVIGLSIISLAFLGAHRDGGGVLRGRAALFALATAGFIGGYSLLDGLGARVSDNAISYVALLMALDAVPLLLVLLARSGWRSVPALLRRDVLRGSVGGVLSLLAYSVVVYAMSVSSIALVVALRETSIVIAALLGWLLLGERGGGWRVAPAFCIVAAVVLLRL